MSSSHKSLTINISTTTILKVILVLLSLFFLYFIRDVIIILFVTIILSAALSPWVSFLEKKRIPRSLGVLIIYLLLLGLFALVISLLVPPVAGEIRDLSQNFPYYFEKVASGLTQIREFSIKYGLFENIERGLEGLSQNLSGASASIFGTLTNLFGGVVALVLIFVLTFYFLVEENALKRLLWTVVPEKYHSKIVSLILKIQTKLERWLRGQLILSFIIFLLSFIGLSILRVKYALVLALVAGILEVIPFIGPTLSLIPAVFLAFTQHPVKALFVIILYILIQQIENHLIVPRVMQKAIGLNPIVVIVVILVGAKLAGILGTLLAIPVATVISICLKDLLRERNSIAEKR